MTLEYTRLHAAALTKLFRKYFTVGENPPGERRANRVERAEVFARLAALQGPYPAIRFGRDANLWATLEEVMAVLPSEIIIPVEPKEREPEGGNPDKQGFRVSDVIPEGPVVELEWFVEHAGESTQAEPSEPQLTPGKLDEETRDALCMDELRKQHSYLDGEIQNHDPLAFEKLVERLMAHTGKDYDKVKGAASDFLKKYFQDGTLKPYLSYRHACRGKQLLNAFLRYFDNGKAFDVADSPPE